MSNDLKPCGHCGGRAALSTYKKMIGTVCRHLVVRQFAVCKVCGTQTKVFKAFDRAAPAWNRRQPDPQATALVEANNLLRACLTSRTLATGDIKGVICTPLRNQIEAHLAGHPFHIDPQATALVEALERCAQIVEQWNHRQNEKVDDVKYIARSAIIAFQEKANA